MIPADVMIVEESALRLLRREQILFCIRGASLCEVFFCTWALIAEERDDILTRILILISLVLSVVVTLAPTPQRSDSDRVLIPFLLPQMLSISATCSLCIFQSTQPQSTAEFNMVILTLTRLLAAWLINAITLAISVRPDQVQCLIEPPPIVITQISSV